MRLYLTFAYLCLIAGPALADPPKAKEKPAILLALVLEDGLVWPFAQYSARTWQSPPEPNPSDRKLNEKTSVWTGSFPSTAKWKPFSGEDNVFHTAPKATEIACHCEIMVGQLIDNRKAPDPEAAHGCDAIRDLAATTVPLDGYEYKVGLPASDASELKAKILAKYTATFDKEEIKLKSAPEGKLLTEAETYRKSPLQMVSFYDFGELQYFVIARTFTPPSEKLLEIGAYYSGWILNNKLIQADFSADDSDGMSSPRIEPLRLITIEGSTFVVAKEIGYETVGLIIFKIEKGKIERVQEVAMGGC